MRQVVYTASPESEQIHVWQLNEQGMLALLQVVSVEGQVQPMVINPLHRLLYVGVRPHFGVISYRISQEGKLTKAGQASLPGSPNYLNIDQYGRYLFCASYHHGLCSISPIDQQGLPQAPRQVIEELEGCHSVNLDLSQRLLFVPALLQDRICLYQLTDEGKLKPHTQQQLNSAEGAGPRHMVFHPNQRYAYSINELNSTVDVWQLNHQQNPICCVQTLDIMPSNFSGKRWAADIHLTPKGDQLFASDRSANIITTLSVSEENGQLAVTGYQPTEQQPRGFNIDHYGNYLISAGQKSHHLGVYRLDDHQGKLQPLGRYAAGLGPMWVVTYPL